MKANTRLNTKLGESKSINHSISQIQMIVKINKRTWEIGKILIALVQFQNNFFSFILSVSQNKYI